MYYYMKIEKIGIKNYKKPLKLIENCINISCNIEKKTKMFSKVHHNEMMIEWSWLHESSRSLSIRRSPLFDIVYFWRF